MKVLRLFRGLIKLAPERIAMDITELDGRVERGLRWSVVRQIVNGLTGTLGALAYTRLLRPEDLGAFGLALLVYHGLLLLVEAPVRDAVIYYRDGQGQHERAAFWLLVAFSIPAVALVLALAQALVRFYQFSADANLVRVIALAFFFKALGVVPAALLLKRFQFALHEGMLMIADSILFVGWVTLAALGFGAWSLVTPVLLATFCWTVAVWAAARFSPFFRPKVDALRDILRYSRSLFGSKLVTYLRGYVDNAAAGMLGERALGLYSMGEDQSAFAVVSVGVPVANIALPVLANVRERMDEFRRIYLGMLRLTATLTMPMQIGVFVLADLGVRVIFGEQWLDAVPVLRAYLAFRLVDALLPLSNAATSAIGRPDIQFKVDILQLPFFVLGTWLAMRSWGTIQALAWTLTVVRILAGLIYLGVTLRVARTTTVEVGRYLLPSSIAGMGMGWLVYAAWSAQVWLFGIAPGFLAQALSLVGLVLFGALSYFSLLFALDRAGFREVLGFARRLLFPKMFRWRFTSRSAEEEQ